MNKKQLTYFEKRLIEERARVMKELGHFPMSENPVKFREYILPVLDRIAR